MAEKLAPKSEYTEFEPVESMASIPSEKRVSSFVYDKKNLRRYTVLALAPETNDECQARYKCDLVELVKMGVRQLMYAQNFIALIDDTKTAEQTQADLQELVDNMTVEPKARKTSDVKKKARELDNANEQAKALGFDSLADMIATYKAKKVKK